MTLFRCQYTVRVVIGIIEMENTTDKDREYFLRGVEQYEKGNNESAINYMTDIVEWNPNQAEAWYYIGLICSEWGKICNGNLFDQEELSYRQEALNALDRAVAVCPDYADAYCLRGSIFYSLENYKNAIDDYSQAIAASSDYADAYYNRGNVYYVLENYQKAIDDYAQAIAASSDYADAYYNRGNVYYRLENYQKAINDYTQAIDIYAEKQQSAAFVYFNRANANRALDNQREAVADYLKAKALQPLKYTEAYYEYLEEIGIDPDDD